MSILIFADLAFLGSLSSSIEVPLIKVIYPGTRGRVQGARKVRIPAIKEGIIRAVSSIMIYII